MERRTGAVLQTPEEDEIALLAGRVIDGICHQHDGKYSTVVLSGYNEDTLQQLGAFLCGTDMLVQIARQGGIGEQDDPGLDFRAVVYPRGVTVPEGREIIYTHRSAVES